VAMCPDTNLGAAHPVDMSGAMASEKFTNDASAYIRSLAKDRGKDEKWAEDAVRKSVSITDAEALGKKISDLTAEDVKSLLAALDKKKVKRLNTTLDLKDAEVKIVKMSGRESLFQVLGDPNVAYVLFLIGVYGLIFELVSPGIGLSGIAGAICILLALFSFGSLPLNFAGVGLVILAIALFILEIKAPTHGAMAAGGVISLFIGSLLMFNPMVPYFRISMGVIMTMIVLTVIFFVIIISLGIAAQKMKAASGKKSLLDKEGEVLKALEPEGIVFVEMEDWTARSKDGKTIDKGEKVKVIAVDGIKLIVEKTSSKKKG
jgi:membrane-bound serine protease (ClpP class)